MSGASRCAEARARGAVDTTPSTVITTPSPTHTNHSGRAALMKSSPLDSSDGPMTEPQSATPILTPIWRLVLVTADAAPARSSGIPLTAALVIGAFTMEKPIPNTVNTTSSAHTGVVAVRKVSMNDATVISTPAASRDGRAP
jgi:hypothetical protein